MLDCKTRACPNIRYSEEAGGTGGKEGKGGKKFLSYKGEGVLRQEAESLRVRPLMSSPAG